MALVPSASYHWPHGTYTLCLESTYVPLHGSAAVSTNFEILALIKIFFLDSAFPGRLSFGIGAVGVGFKKNFLGKYPFSSSRYCMYFYIYLFCLVSEMDLR